MQVSLLSFSGDKKVVREGKLNPAAKYGGIPLYTGLKNRNPFSKIRS